MRFLLVWSASVLLMASCGGAKNPSITAPDASTDTACLDSCDDTGESPDGSPDASVLDTGGDDANPGDAKPGDTKPGDTQPNTDVKNEACQSDEDCANTPQTPACKPSSNVCVECMTDDHCLASPDLPLCNVEKSVCVACLDDTHCAPDGECVANACSPIKACASSKDCPGQVCWTAKGKCVDCLGPEDCDNEMICFQTVCQPACKSDKECLDKGQVCDKERMTCVDCVGHEDCDDSFHCKDSVCLPDVCSSAGSACVNHAVAGCTPEGDAFVVIQACGPNQACKEQDGQASCIDHLCAPGGKYCLDGHAQICAIDGLSVVSDLDCAALGQVCFQGKCQEGACQPGASVCQPDGLTKAICVQGGTQWVDEPCPAGTFCQLQDAGAVCVPRLCQPNAPTCLGEVAGTCDAIGSGLVAAGTDCAKQGLTCQGGLCTACKQSELCDGIDNDCDGQTDENPTDCPDGACFAGTCYQGLAGINCLVKAHNGHVYMACYKNNTNWTQAKAVCEGWHGSHLVVVNNTQEEQFLLTMISGPAYIGYTDDGSEGQWSWVGGQSSHKNWCPQQPDNWGGAENCAMMNAAVAGGWQCWNDVQCWAQDNRFICEVDSP